MRRASAAARGGAAILQRASAAAEGPDPRAVAAVRRALVAAGFSAAGVAARFGAAEADLAPAEQEALWRWRARGVDPLSVLVCLFLLQEPVPLGPVQTALGAVLTDFQMLGLLARRQGQVNPLVQLSLHGDIVIASDRKVARPPAHYVLGPTNATMGLERWLIKRPVRRALDLGTGPGYLALRLAGQATRVVGTDVDGRALGFARLNAALNGVRNVAFAASDRFAALGARRFDLIVGNLPFVISPGRRFVFRDGGAPVDGFLESVVRATGRHLAPGGWAQYLGQWAHRDGEAEDERLAPWIAAAACDTLIWRLEIEPVDRYAARWSAGPGAPDARTRARQIAAWMRFYEAAGIRAISTGLLTLRPRAGRRSFFSIEEAPPGAAEGAAILERFAALDDEVRGAADDGRTAPDGAVPYGSSALSPP